MRILIQAFDPQPPPIGHSTRERRSRPAYQAQKQPNSTPELIFAHVGILVAAKDTSQVSPAWYRRTYERERAARLETPHGAGRPCAAVGVSRREMMLKASSSDRRTALYQWAWVAFTCCGSVESRIAARPDNGSSERKCCCRATDSTAAATQEAGRGVCRHEWCLQTPQPCLRAAVS